MNNLSNIINNINNFLQEEKINNDIYLILKEIFNKTKYPKKENINDLFNPFENLEEIKIVGSKNGNYYGDIFDDIDSKDSENKVSNSENISENSDEELSINSIDFFSNSESESEDDSENDSKDDSENYSESYSESKSSVKSEISSIKTDFSEDSSKNTSIDNVSTKNNCSPKNLFDSFEDIFEKNKKDKKSNDFDDNDFEIEDIELDNTNDFEINEYVEMNSIDNTLNDKEETENLLGEEIKPKLIFPPLVPLVLKDKTKLKKTTFNETENKLLDLEKLNKNKKLFNPRRSPVIYRFKKTYISNLFPRKLKPRTYKFRCPECFLGFNQEWSLNDHYLVEHNSFENTDPDYRIPVSPDGKYECPLCKNKYITDGLLGEHFILEHNDYDELCNLDEKKNTIGYPSLFVLEYISMIKTFNKKEIEKLIYKNEECNICYSKFKFKKKKFKSIKKDNNDGYNSDIEIFNRNNNIKFIDDNKFLERNKKTKFKNRKIGIDVRNITIDKLIKIINEFRKREYIPIKLLCCKKNICEACFIEYLKYSNSIICPFCKKDHTNENKDYIRIIDLDENIDGKKWKKWWIRNLDIFTS